MKTKKRDVVARVAEDSGVDQETCAKVIKSFERVMQRELGEFGDISEAFGKIGSLAERLFGPKES